MTLSDVAIRRPVFTGMMSVTLIVLGVLGYRRLGTDLYPDVVVPVRHHLDRLPRREPRGHRAVGDPAGRGRGLVAPGHQERLLVVARGRLDGVHRVPALGRARGRGPERPRQGRRGAGAAPARRARAGHRPVRRLRAAGARLLRRVVRRPDRAPREARRSGPAAARAARRRRGGPHRGRRRARDRGRPLPRAARRARADARRGVPADPRRAPRPARAATTGSGAGKVGIRVRGEFRDVDALRRMPVATAATARSSASRDVAPRPSRREGAEDGRAHERRRGGRRRGREAGGRELRRRRQRGEAAPPGPRARAAVPGAGPHRPVHDHRGERAARSGSPSTSAARWPC